MADSIDDKIVDQDFAQDTVSVYLYIIRYILLDGNVFLFKMLFESVGTLPKQMVQRYRFRIIKLMVVNFSQQQKIFIDPGTSDECFIDVFCDSVLFFGQILSWSKRSSLFLMIASGV